MPGGLFNLCRRTRLSSALAAPSDYLNGDLAVRASRVDVSLWKEPGCSNLNATELSSMARVEGPGQIQLRAMRAWRRIKYEEVYLRAYESVGEAHNSIGRYLDFYNGRRPHSSLDDATPDQAYFNQPPFRLAA